MPLTSSRTSPIFGRLHLSSWPQERTSLCRRPVAGSASPPSPLMGSFSSGSSNIASPIARPSPPCWFSITWRRPDRARVWYLHALSSRMLASRGLRYYHERRVLPRAKGCQLAVSPEVSQGKESGEQPGIVTCTKYSRNRCGGGWEGAERRFQGSQTCSGVRLWCRRSAVVQGLHVNPLVLVAPNLQKNTRRRLRRVPYVLTRLLSSPPKPPRAGWRRRSLRSSFSIEKPPGPARTSPLSADAVGKQKIMVALHARWTFARG